MSKIAIIDYGMANLRSVQKGLEKVGYSGDIVHDPNQLSSYEKLILPGVGAFRDAIGKLRESQMDAPILEHIQQGKKFLGICLGLHLLFEVSYEEGQYPGLGVFEGDVVRFKNEPGLKVPHMGWNQLQITKKAPPLSEVPNESEVYFVHSYYVQPKDDSIVSTWTNYPQPFTSSIWHENVFASQFHPEKSQKIGLSILKSFAEW